MSNSPSATPHKTGMNNGVNSAINGLLEKATSAVSVGAGSVTSLFINEDRAAQQLKDMIQRALRQLPWRVEVQDWKGNKYSAGGNEKHWSGEEALFIHIKTPSAGRTLLALDAMSFLEKFLDQEVDMQGNLFLFPEIRNYAKLKLKPWQIVWNRIYNQVLQDKSIAGQSVKSHYDIPEEALYYLDHDTRSYSCAIWEEPFNLSEQDVLRVGKGRGDDWDSLEKAQFRKFLHAANYLAPAQNETVLDVGCGYPGFIRTTLENYPGRVVGWTHSANQVNVGRQMLGQFDAERYELNEGDYRQDTRLYDHIHSTGMICHVGPEGKDSGLTNYVREVRRRIKMGGRYVHHCMMVPHTAGELFDSVGPAFNRKYVWPGFYYYSLAEHITALENNGFHVVQLFDLTPHYAKTTYAWYRRMMQQKERFVQHTNEATLRAWQVYLGGLPGSYLNGGINTYRLFCVAQDAEVPSIKASDPLQNVAARRKINI